MEYTFSFNIAISLSRPKTAGHQYTLQSPGFGTFSLGLHYFQEQGRRADRFGRESRKVNLSFSLYTYLHVKKKVQRKVHLKSKQGSHRVLNIEPWFNIWKPAYFVL